MNRIRQFITPPIFEDEEKTRTAGLLNIILIAVFVIASALTLVVGLLGSADMPSLATGAATAVWALVLWFVMRRGHVQLASVFLSFMFLVNVTVAVYFSGTIRDPVVTVYIVCIAVASLLVSNRAALVFTLLSLLALFGLLQAETAGLLTRTVQTPVGLTEWAVYAASFGITAVLLGLATTSINRALETARRNNRELQAVRDSLEDRVAERTRELQETTTDLSFRSQELEVSNVRLEEARRRQQEINRELQEANERTRRRAAQLQAVAEVGRAIAQVRDPDELLPQVTELVSRHFGYYHVGIFMLDQARRYAVLRAANSEGGRRMLARNHKLAVGRQGVVGYVTSTGEPRIALDVGADAAHFANPDLPDTRSEVALPLQIGGQIIGALDVQSVEPEAFDEQDVAVLSALADQVAIAIENARLFQQSQEALAEVKEAQRRYVQEVWQEFLRQRPDLQFEYALEGIPSALGVELPTTRQAVAQGELVAVSDLTGDGGDDSVARAALSVPIKLRGQVIGVLDLHEADETRTWTEHEMSLAQTVADQMAQAVESARLFEQTQSRARHEALTRRITERIREALDVDDMLQTAVQELGQALGAPQVYIRLGVEDKEMEPAAPDTEAGR